MKRYANVVFDSARWEGFPFRADDIVISTPPKSGTTWMQTLCAMAVLDTVEFDRPLAQISPWLDMQTNALDRVLATLQAQEHRRIIKTHTPLDGLPWHESVTYLCVGRDPRDVALSFEHHLANLDMTAFMAARAAAVGLEDLADLGAPPEPVPADPVERFRRWADGGDPSMLPSLPAILGHLATFWQRRDEPNIALFHYADLLADLPAEYRRLTDLLGIDLSDARLEELASAAGFAQMRQRADQLVPDVGNQIWISNSDFFHRGTSGQWGRWLNADTLRDYDARVAELVPADLVSWAHSGWHADPPAAQPVVIEPA